MVAEVEAMYAETRSETGLAAMSTAVRAAIGKVERHRLVAHEQRAAASRNHPLDHLPALHRRALHGSFGFNQ
jgi:hypothetical protein